MKESFVYILATHRNGTLYIGSTSNILKRIWEHKNNVIPGFTAKYNVHQLVYYEIHQTILGAALRERQMKKLSRKQKLDVIEKFNPVWQDLYENIR
ncbi:MAG: GIY-YIG nuclease family protein [Gammaproteobacteria bacterium]